MLIKNNTPSSRGAYFCVQRLARPVNANKELKALPHPGRLLEACRRDDRNSTRHCGTFLAAIQKGFACH